MARYIKLCYMQIFHLRSNFSNFLNVRARLVARTRAHATLSFCTHYYIIITRDHLPTRGARVCPVYAHLGSRSCCPRLFFFPFFFFFSFFLFFFFPKSSTRPSRQPIVPRSSTPFYISANWWSNYFLKFNSFVSDSLRVDS